MVTEFLAVVYAQNEYGDRRADYLGTPYRAFSDAKARADRAAAALGARAAKGKLPVAFDRWFDARPVYGSDAYVAYGQSDDLAWEARQDAEEAWN